MFSNISLYKNRKLKWFIKKEGEVPRLKIRGRNYLVRDHGLVTGPNQMTEKQDQGMNSHLATKHQLFQTLSREDQVWKEIRIQVRSFYRLKNSSLLGIQVQEDFQNLIKSFHPP